jgi:hypothetical protein
MPPESAPEFRMLHSHDDWIRHLTALAGPGTAPDLDGVPPTVLREGDPDATLWGAACAAPGDPAILAADGLLASRPGDSLAASGGDPVKLRNWSTVPAGTSTTPLVYVR